MSQESWINGQQFLDAGENEAARVAFAQILAENPGDTESLIGYGKALSRLGQFSAALDAFGKALECDPHNAEAHHNIGWILHFQMKAWKKARAHAEQAVSLAPGVAKYHIMASECARMRFDNRTALKHLKIAYSLDPAAFDRRLRRHLMNLEISAMVDQAFAPLYVLALLLSPPVAYSVLASGQEWGITLGILVFGIGSAFYALHRRYRLALVLFGLGILWVIAAYSFLRFMSR